ncbi:MAG: chemotaxis protein CheA [Roseivivax sp.]|nr:chemotaxis protein CheA [Roseivivax sp.]
MSKSSIRDTFFEECEDLLEALMEGLTELEDNPGDDEIVNAVFRAVHSIKGGAGAFGLDDLVSFAHTFETVLDMVRDKTLFIDPDLMRIFNRSGDKLTDLVEAARDGTEIDTVSRDAVMNELEQYLSDQPEEEIAFAAAPLDFAPAPLDADEPDLPPFEPESAASDAGPNVFRIVFVPTAELYTHGHEPLLIIDHLAKLGQVEVALDISDVPAFSQIDNLDYPGWTIRLTTENPMPAVEAVFEFVEGLCQISIVDEADMPGLPPIQPPAPPPVIERPKASPLQSATPQKDKEREQKGPKATLRVDLERVDRLINNVGELIINQAMISQCIEELNLPPTSQIFNEIEDYKLLARDIQEGVMAIRAQPVKPLFQRMARIVREASEATGKQARFLTVGENTEIDKTVIERLADPLTHMIRNAVDHGLESADKRLAAGKDEMGTIRLTAAHRSGNVILEIADDGAGINRAAVQRKAVEKGLISADAELTESEIDNLLFAPGFSTATEVSNLSGRGVGMDVVKTAVAKLGGRISVGSVQGEGTTFSIILPLTLAVMDGFVVSIADQTMVVPISSILETVSAASGDIQIMGQAERLLRLRGRYIPIVNVAHSLALQVPEPVENPIYLIVESEPQGLCALEIGEIHDQRQIVVKSLDSDFGTIAGISAATILGDGKIALILDTDEISRGAAPQSLDTLSLIQNADFQDV